MRDQEAAMPDNSNADNEARNDFHGRVNDQHGKVNDAHGQVNNAHGIVVSAASSVRMYERTLANAQAREETLEQIIASSTTRIRQDSQTSRTSASWSTIRVSDHEVPGIRNKLLISVHQRSLSIRAARVEMPAVGGWFVGTDDHRWALTLIVCVR
jgi:hypothetical protein